MRTTLFLLALLAPLTSAQAATTDCKAIADSLLRLRCYDDRDAPAPAAKPTAAAPLKVDYAAYPAGPRYQGPARLPDFTGRDRDYAMFRTRLRDGIRQGANFAGHMAMIQFGCGTGCSVVYAADVRTGQVYPFALGGEDAQALGLEYRPTSNLVVAQWEDVEKDRCLTAHYVWTGRGFDQVAKRDLGKREVCWEANRN